MLPLLDARALQVRLGEHVRRLGVTGAVAGISAGPTTITAAAGVSRLGSGIPITPSTTFLIASVTKVWTATLVMQLVDEGLVDPSAPVSAYLHPPLRLSDTDVAQRVTVAELLSHTGGFFGDAPEPDFRDEDAVERLVATYADLPQIHRRGSMFSYSNAGYIILGRLVECVTRMSWDDALRARLIDPLSLQDTSTLPELTMTRPLAVGHVPAFRGSKALVPVDRWQDARGSGPCGGTLATTAGDLLAFARMHLRDGIADSGRRVLSAKSARAMRVPRIDQPDASAGAWGWGWSIDRRDGHGVIGHIGSTAGQRSRLVLIPDREIAICILATGDADGLLRDEFSTETLGMLGVEPVPFASADGDEPETRRGNYDGRYRLDDETVIVHTRDGRLYAAFEIDGEEEPAFRTPVPLEWIAGDTFRALRPPSLRPTDLTFIREAGTSVSHVAMSLRAYPRVSAATGDQDES